MDTRKSHKTYRTVTAVVIAGLAVVGGLLIRSARADDYGQQAPVIRSILLFPVTDNSGQTGQDVAKRVDEAVRTKLAVVNKFKIVPFSLHLSAVQRGLDDKDLSEMDVQSPFSDDDKDQVRAAKIADRIGTDAYFVGSVDSYSADPASKAVTLQVTGNVYYTGLDRSAKSVGVAVTAKPLDSSEGLTDVIGDAVNNAAAQIAGGINAIQSGSATGPVVTHHHHMPFGL